MWYKYQIFTLTLGASLLHAGADLDTRVAELEKKINLISVENTRKTLGAKNADNLPTLKDPKNFSLGIGFNYQKLYLTDNAYGYISSGSEVIEGSSSNSKVLSNQGFFYETINIQYANTNSEALNLDYTGNGRLIESSFDWDFGINASIGYKTALDDVVIKATYNHFKTSSTNSFNATNRQLVYFGTPFTGITGPAYFQPMQYFNFLNSKRDFVYYLDTVSAITSVTPIYSNSYLYSISTSYDDFFNNASYAPAIYNLYPKFVQRNSINADTSNIIPVDKLKIASNFNYNLLSLELAKAYFVSSNISFESKLGLFTGWFSSKTKLNFSEGREFFPFSQQFESTYDGDGSPPKILGIPVNYIYYGDLDIVQNQFFDFSPPFTYTALPQYSLFDFDYAYNNSPFINTNWGPNNLKFDLDSEFWGIGPKFAFDSKLDLSNCFGLFLDTELAVLYGSMKSSNTQTWTGAYPFVRASDASWYAYDFTPSDSYFYYAPPREPLVEHSDGISYKLNSSTKNFAPYVHLNLGMSYDWTSKSEKHNVKIVVGYDGQYIAQVIKKIDVDGVSLSSIGTNGINANLTWSF